MKKNDFKKCKNCPASFYGRPCADVDFCGVKKSACEHKRSVISKISARAFNSREL